MISWNEIRSSSVSSFMSGLADHLRHVAELLGMVVVHEPEGGSQVGAGQVELAVEHIPELVVVDLVVDVGPGVPGGDRQGVCPEVLGDRQTVGRAQCRVTFHSVGPGQCTSLMAHLVNTPRPPRGPSVPR